MENEVGIRFIIEDEETIGFSIEDETELDMALGDALINAEDREEYTGDTTITPRIREAQILDTAGKVVNDDITVEQVPIYAVTNPAGGVTYYIGE